MLLGYVTATYGFAFSGMVSFLVPLRAQEIGASYNEIGLLVGAGALVPALLSVPSGELSDRLGPRKTYLLGTLVSGVATLLGATTSSYWVLFALQLVMGLARSTAWVASQAYLTSVGRPEERATITGRMSFATNAGTIVAPLAIGLSAEALGYRWSFVTIGALTLAYTLMGLVLPEVRVPRTTTHRGSSGGLGLALNLLKLQGMQVVLQLTFVRLWNTTAWSAFYQVYLDNHGITPVVIGTILAVGNAVSTGVTLTAGWFAARSSNALATAFALGLGTIGVALSPFLLSFPLIFIPSILVGFAVGLSLPLLVATVSEEAPPDQRGVALGLRMSVNQGAGTVAPTAAGAVGALLGPALGFLFAAGVSAVVLTSAVSMHLAARRQRAQGLAAASRG